MSLALKASLLLKRWEFSRNSRLSRAKLEAVQLKKFRRLVAHANSRSPYYSDLIKTRSIDIESCMPTDFPVLTKTDVMENFDRIVTDRRITKDGVSSFFKTSKDPADLYLDRFYAIHTSGSSGEVGISVFSKLDWARGFAQVGRNNPLPSLFKTQKYACFFAADGHYAGASWATTLKTMSPRRSSSILILDINTPLSEVIQKLNNFQPDVLGGYPSATKILAEKQNEGHLSICPEKIILSGEVITDRERIFIETSFKSKVANSYNCTEHMSMGAAPAGKSTIRLWEDDLIFEINEDHTLVTNLFNRTLPLIRYRMADSLVLNENRDATQPYVEVAGVVGRTENAAVFTNEAGVDDFISPHVISEIFVPGVTRFQIQLLSKQAFRFVACLAKGDGQVHADRAIAGLTARIDEVMAKKKMRNVKFSVDIADELPSDPRSGKFRLVMAMPATPAAESVD